MTFNNLLLLRSLWVLLVSTGFNQSSRVIQVLALLKLALFPHMLRAGWLLAVCCLVQDSLGSSHVSLTSLQLRLIHVKGSRAIEKAKAYKTHHLLCHILLAKASKSSVQIGKQIPHLKGRSFKVILQRTWAQEEFKNCSHFCNRLTTPMHLFL